MFTTVYIGNSHTKGYRWQDGHTKRVQGYMMKNVTVMLFGGTTEGKKTVRISGRKK